MKKNTKMAQLKDIMGYNAPYHWTCMPSKKVTRHNVDAFIAFLERLHVLDVIGGVMPMDVKHYTIADDDRGFIRGEEMLYVSAGTHIRIQLEWVKSTPDADDEVPVKAALEIETILTGCRRNYVSTDTMAILRVMKAANDKADLHALLANIKNLRKEVARQKRKHRRSGNRAVG